MENNIFFKNKKDKFNPDVISGLSKKSSERRQTNFAESKNIYNPITNEVPKQVKNVKDLRLNLDTFMPNTKSLLTQKMDERNRQEYDLKPQKLKTLPQNLIVDKHINNFDELKKSSETHIKTVLDEKNNQKNNYNDIINSMKNLGLLK